MFLAGLAGAGGVGAGLWVLARGGDASTIEAVEREVLWAPTDIETVHIPQRGRITHLEFFATWCGICSNKMPALGEYHSELAGSDVQFVSVSTEPVGMTVDPETVVEWWDEHDGRWPVTYDDGYHFARELGVTSVPMTIIFDEVNRVVHDVTGGHTTEELLALLADTR